MTFVDAQGRAFTAKPVGIEKSQKRRKLKMALASAKAERGAPVDPAQIAAMVLRFDGEGSGWRVWVDNVEFKKERPFLGKTWLLFEVFKALRVLIPSFTGFIAFVGLVWALRIEEGRQVFDWLKVHGLDKVLAKIRRKGSAAGANAPDTAPETEDAGDPSDKE